MDEIEELERIVEVNLRAWKINLNESCKEVPMMAEMMAKSIIDNGYRKPSSAQGQGMDEERIYKLLKHEQGEIFRQQKAKLDHLRHYAKAICTAYKEGKLK
jgi:hypothetical protein